MITGNEPMMPIVGESGHCTRVDNIAQNTEACGLTIRQHFAAMAMQGWNANSLAMPNDENVRYLAALSVKQADALIAELNKQS